MTVTLSSEALDRLSRALELPGDGQPPGRVRPFELPLAAAWLSGRANWRSRRHLKWNGDSRNSEMTAASAVWPAQPSALSPRAAGVFWRAPYGRLDTLRVAEAGTNDRRLGSLEYCAESEDVLP